MKRESHVEFNAAAVINELRQLPVPKSKNTQNLNQTIEWAEQ